MATHWNEPLARPIRLRDGTTLTTLAAAGNCLTARFASITRSAPLEHAIALLMLAAETGDVVHRADATEQLERVLAARGLL